MSADNFFIVKPHPKGGFTYVQGFASDEEAGPWLTPTPEHRQWPTVALALQAAMNDYSEYGVSVDPSCGNWTEEETIETIPRYRVAELWADPSLSITPDPLGPWMKAEDVEKHKTTALAAAEAENIALRQVIDMLGANENTEALIELAKEANDLIYASGQRDALATRTPTTDELIVWLHSRFIFEYDECDHGTYTGGTNDGKPYAMCERIGTALNYFLTTYKENKND